MKKAIALILILALLAGGGFYLLKMEQQDNERMKNLYAEVEPLEREREALMEERNGLETQYKVKMRDYSTVEVFFQELDSQIVSDVWPVMRSRGVVGMIPLSYNEYPGYWKKMTFEDIKTLVSDGWGIYVIVDNGWSQFDTWFKSMAKTLENKNLPVPTTIYFPNNDYKPEMDEKLIECGITTVVLNASDGRSNTVSDVYGDLWFTGAMPFGYTNSISDLELLGRTDGGNLVLTVKKLVEIWDKTKNKNVDSQERQDFIDVLDSWLEKELVYEEDLLQDLETVGPTPYIYVDTNDPTVLHQIYLDSLTPEQQLLLPKFRSTTTDMALSLHRELQQTSAALTREMEAKKASLDRQIAEMDAKITETYNRYGAGKLEKAEHDK